MRGGQAGVMQVRVARYYVLAVCDACGGLDLMKMVQLDDGPTDRQSIVEAYSGKPLPPDLLDLPRLLVTCRKTGTPFVQSDYDKMYLEPFPD